MNSYSRTLLRFSGLFALIGAFIGSHMAGSHEYGFRSIHAHILLVGWLSLFAWAVFYKIFHIHSSKLATVHVYTGIIGAIGLSVGMWMYYLNPFNTSSGLNTVIFIVGGTVLLISFFLFAILTFTIKEKNAS